MLAGNDGEMMVITKRASHEAWIKAVLLSLVMLALLLWCQQALASDGTEFDAAVTKFSGWVKGNLGKLAALVAVGVGAIVAAVRKDWSWFFGAVVLSVGVGIIVGIINASFTATI